MTMRRIAAGVTVLALAAAIVFEVRPRFWNLVLVAGVCGVALWQLGRCRHRGPLGLLPPIHNADGTDVPARWFCDACSRTWPAVFERDQHPVMRFEGYDESKAQNSARRADELERRQRALALRRAGMVASVVPPRRARRGVDTAEVVPILQSRRFGK